MTDLSIELFCEFDDFVLVIALLLADDGEARLERVELRLLALVQLADTPHLPLNVILCQHSQRANMYRYTTAEVLVPNALFFNS